MSAKKTTTTTATDTTATPVATGLPTTAPQSNLLEYIMIGLSVVSIVVGLVIIFRRRKN